MQFQKALIGALSVAATFLASTAVRADGEVNIYSYRQPDLIKPLLDAFTEKTGITTNVLSSTRVLSSASRLKAQLSQPT